MAEFKIGQIIKVSVIGIQHYGIFVRSFDDEQYSGLIHISEISSDFVKDINKIASIGDIMYAKIIDVDNQTHHIKLSIKAINPKARYKHNYNKIKSDDKIKDFSSLNNHLNNWVQEQLKEIKENAKN